MSSYILAVDPGVSGGVCLLSPQKEIVELINTPENVYGMWGWLHHTLHNRSPAEETGNVKAVMEKVGGFVGKKDPGAHMFVFGRSYGRWEGVLAALGLWPFDNPTPQRWQKALGVPPKLKDESKESHKRKLCAFARTLYPNEKRITLHTCDALLLAHYRSLQ